MAVGLSKTMNSGRQQKQALIQEYLNQMPLALRDSFSATQMNAVEHLLEKAIVIPKPQPKLVDLRFVVDLVITRFYVVLWVGKDRRSQPRTMKTEGITRASNRVAAVLLLLAMNLLISGIVLLAVYLVKSALGIDLLPGHFGRS
jgi:hypothetical protein